MNLTDSFILKCQAGLPVFLNDICAIYPSTLKEIATIGYDTFLQYLQILTMEKPALDRKEKSELNEILETLTDFQYFILMVNMDKELNQKVKEAFRFFTREAVSFSLEPAQIILGPLEEKHLMDEESFYDFRRILKRMFFLEQESEEIIIYENDSPAVKKLKMQMKKNREKVAKAKAKAKRNKQSGGDLQFSDLVGSVAAGNCGLNIKTIWDITYYAFHDQLKRMGWHEQFDINNRAAMAGAKIKKSQLKHWIKSIVSDDKNN